MSALVYRGDWTASTGSEEVTAQQLQEEKGSTGCPTGGRRGFGAWIVLPGSGIVPHVYSSPPRSQPMGRCTADIPGPPPQASSSSSSLYGLDEQSKEKRQRDTFNVNLVFKVSNHLRFQGYRRASKKKKKT